MELISGRVVCLAGVRATLAAKRPAGYSADMTVWQYAQLRVTRDLRLTASGNWTIAWYGPDATTQDTAEIYSHVVAELNRAGTEGWELVNVAAMDAGDSGQRSGESDWSLTIYTFRRPHIPTVAKIAEPIQEESLRSRILDFGPADQTMPEPDDEDPAKHFEEAQKLRRTQAGRVFMWQERHASSPRGRQGPGFAAAAAAQKGRNERKPVVTARVKNGSDQPIYYAEFTWHRGTARYGSPNPEHLGTIMPGDDTSKIRVFPQGTNLEVSGAVVRFTDAAGIRWLRRPDGYLIEER